MNSIIQADCLRVISTVNMEKFKNKSVLITGASGLVGVYIVSCLKLLKQDYNIDIWCWIKNDIDTKFKTIFEGCNIIKEDITNAEILKSIPMFDYIFHSAGYGQPLKFVEDKIKTIQLNTSTTIALFEKLKVNGTLLFVSSSEIYNGLNQHNVTEDQIGTTNTDHPRSCYIESKRTGEAICHAFTEKGIDAKIVRLSTSYGPGTKKNDKRVLNTLIDRGIHSEQIQLMDDGSARRVFCYISDVVEMVFNIFLHGKELTYNVAGVYETSILDLANIIGSKLHKPVVIPENNSSMLVGNPKSMNISIKKYTDEFKKDSSSFVNFEIGLDQTIEWQKFICSNG